MLWYSVRQNLRPLLHLSFSYAKFTQEAFLNLLHFVDRGMLENKHSVEKYGQFSRPENFCLKLYRDFEIPLYCEIL